MSEVCPTDLNLSGASELFSSGDRLLHLKKKFRHSESLADWLTLRFGSLFGFVINIAMNEFSHVSRSMVENIPYIIIDKCCW